MIQADNETLALDMAAAQLCNLPNFEQPTEDFIAEVKRHIGRNRWEEPETIFIPVH